MHDDDAWWQFARRVAWAGLLLWAYVGVWGDTGRRAYIAHVARPVLETAAPADSWRIRTAGGGRVIHVYDAVGTQVARHTAPAGVRFLLPGLLCILVAPTRWYWVGLWTGHLVLGGVGLALLAAALAGSEASYAAHAVLTRYLVDAFSLGVTAFAVIREGLLPMPTRTAPDS
jgi:hypothetical protein